MKTFSMLVKTSFVAASLLLITPSALSAQNRGYDMPTFQSFDLNKDGQLTEDEMKEAREKRMKEREEDGRMLRNSKSHYEFSRIDANGDGVVTEQEFKDHQTRRRR